MGKPVLKNGVVVIISLNIEVKRAREWVIKLEGFELKQGPNVTSSKYSRRGGWKERVSGERLPQKGSGSLSGEVKKLYVSGV